MLSFKSLSMKKIALILFFCVFNFHCYIFDKKDKRILAYMDSMQVPPMTRIANALSKKVEDKNSFRVIVLTFTEVNGRRNEYGEVLAEKLSTELAKNNHIIVLDRLLYQKKLQENDLSLQGGTDLNSMRKIGSILELNGIVVGLVSPYMNGLDVNCRLLEPNTGTIISAEESYYPLGTNE
jgi:TolB-like protein